MAYVRKRGKQLVIVQGIRDPESGKVNQQILFTIYSKAEALHILGRGRGTRVSNFRYLLEQQYPDIRFDWDKLLEGIKADINVLPDLYEYKETRLRSQFHKDLCAFARQLMLADPQNLICANDLIQDHSTELNYLAELIQWRLSFPKRERTQGNEDNPFYWRFTLQGNGVPPDIEEQVEAFFERGEYARAAKIFQLLIDTFDDYAEGYNYLGLISLNTKKLEEAICHFQKAMEVGRKLFPKKIARSRYWSDLSTRPYVRAMRNLAFTLNRADRYEEALQYCDRLEQECGDLFPAASYRTWVYLNKGLWLEAADSVLKLGNFEPSNSLIAAFALYELGRIEEAAFSFVHGALNFPRAAKILVGIRTTSPGNHHEASDHNAGIDISQNLEKYLLGAGRKSTRYFKRLLEQLRTRELLAEIEDVTKRWLDQNGIGEAFERMHQMQTPEFARGETAKILRSLTKTHVKSST